MKIRNGFISNSSSSSYVIAYDTKLCDPSELFRSGECYSRDDTSVDALGLEDVFEDLKDWYEISDRDEDEEIIKYYHDRFIKFSSLMSKISRAVENGDGVAIVSISYGDDNAVDNLYSDGIRVIESFG